MATKEILAKPINKVFFEQSDSEPSLYSCLDTRYCKGGIKTGYGYFLRCQRCSEEAK